ncbi:MAG: DNA polymerase family X protein [Faunusvirus sp.]|jgi:DNA polymerase beta|uniref:DNA-directed DNA polymerase n=1 Tax=Faunusvirus sp. TaxID=2487766 RepID=A0A3G5A1M4_9VIRU|nr:MAG: DNA polymerase family X protein [Faunusvirus sp.]
MPQLNRQLIDEFEKLINLTQYIYNITIDEKEKKVEMFKLNIFKNALKIIQRHPTEIKHSSDLDNYYGIGKGIKKRIDEILTTGKLSELSEAVNKKKLASIMRDAKLVDDLSAIIGIGKKTAIKLIRQYNITSLDDLIKRYKSGKIILNDKIARGLKYYKQYERKIPRSQMDEINKFIQHSIHELGAKYSAVICGSYRREKPISNDIDVLVTHADVPVKKDDDTHLQQIIDKLKADNFIVGDLVDNFKTKYMGFCKLNDYPVRRIDVRFVGNTSFPTAILYFTGSDSFNKRMRLTAKKMGYKLSEYGLYKLINKNGETVERKISINSEEDVFKILGMKYVLPRERI